MKVLIDTNVILDVLCNRVDIAEASSKVWKYCEVDKLEGYISALSIPNIVYILRKELTPEKTQLSGCCSANAKCQAFPALKRRRSMGRDGVYLQRERLEDLER